MIVSLIISHLLSQVPDAVAEKHVGQRTRQHGASRMKPMQNSGSSCVACVFRICLPKFQENFRRCNNRVRQTPSPQPKLLRNNACMVFDEAYSLQYCQHHLRPRPSMHECFRSVLLKHTPPAPEQVDSMPGKRLSVAAALQPAAAKKAARGADGPVVACVRHWGGAAWVFEGLKTQGGSEGRLTHLAWPG